MRRLAIPAWIALWLAVVMTAATFAVRTGTVHAGNRSDAKAFAKAQATWTELDAAFEEAWGVYTASTSGAEKLTALNDVETVVAGGQDAAAAMEVRACFRPWHRALTSLYVSLVNAVVSLRAGTAMTPEAIADGTFYVTAMNSPAFAGLFHCTEGAS